MFGMLPNFRHLVCGDHFRLVNIHAVYAALIVVLAPTSSHCTLDSTYREIGVTTLYFRET